MNKHPHFKPGVQKKRDITETKTKQNQKKAKPVSVPALKKENT